MATSSDAKTVETPSTSAPPEQPKHFHHPTITAPMQRINFLHQAAINVSSNSTDSNDVFSKISRRMMRQLREVANMDRVKMSPGIVRTFCPKCKQVLVGKMVRKSSEELTDEKRGALLKETQKKFSTVRSRHDRLTEMLLALDAISKPKGRAKQIASYTDISRSSELQADMIRKMLADIERVKKSDNLISMSKSMNRQYLMRLIQDVGNSLPVYVRRADEVSPPYFVGGLQPPETVTLRNGDMVAAFQDDNWIVAEVLSVNTSGKYEVKDVDSSTSIKASPGHKSLFTVTRKNLIALPKWQADPERDSSALFPLNAIVLALYPQTTCFYKGVIHKVPSRFGENYEIAFEDPFYPSGYSPPLPVSQRYVVQYKKERCTKKQNDD